MLNHKSLRDFLTFLALVFAVSMAHEASGLLRIALMVATAFAFYWTLERNVEYGVKLVEEEEEEE